MADRSKIYQKMLDELVLDYMIKKNRRQAAAIFAKEADVPLDELHSLPRGGYLEDWWGLFWDLYLSRLPTHPEAVHSLTSNPEVVQGSTSNLSTDGLHQNATADQINAGNSSQNIRLSPNMNISPTMGMPTGLETWSWKDMYNLLQNPASGPIGGMPGLHNHPQTAHSTVMPSPNMVDFRQSVLPMRTTPSPNKANLLQSDIPVTTTPSPNMTNLLQSDPNPNMENLLQSDIPTRTTLRQNTAELLQSDLPMMTTPSTNVADLLQSDLPITTTPSPNMGNPLQSDLPTTAQRPELDSNRVGSTSSLDFNAGNFTGANRQEQQHPRSRDSRQEQP